MKARALSIQLALITSLAVLAPRLGAYDGLQGAWSRANMALPFGPTLAVADFDNDQKADAAVLVDYGRLGEQHDVAVEVHLSGRDNTIFSFQRTETAYSVSAWDIDRDGDIDVIVQCPFTGQRLRVLLNDGRGSFYEGRIEDFLLPAVPTRQHFRLPSSSVDSPSLAAPPKQASEFALLTPGRAPCSPSLTGKLRWLSTVAWLTSCPFLLNSSRAPPVPYAN